MVDGIIAALTAALALVLGASGTLKLPARGRLSVEDLAALKVPAPLQTLIVARAVPVIEIAIAGGLLIAPVLLPIAAVTFGTLAIFTGLVSRVVARGERVECACFGAARSRIDVTTVVRNAVLTLMATVVVVFAADRAGAVIEMIGLSAVGWAAFFATTTLAGAAVCIAVIFRHPREREPRDSEVAQMPDVELLTPRGELVRVIDLARHSPLLLVLLSADCDACSRIVSQIDDWQSRFGDSVDVRVVTSDDPAAFHARHPGIGVEVDYGYRAILDAIGIRFVPSALLVARDGSLAAVAEGVEQVELLAMTIESASALTPGV